MRGRVLGNSFRGTLVKRALQNKNKISDEARHCFILMTKNLACDCSQSALALGVSAANLLLFADSQIVGAIGV